MPWQGKARRGLSCHLHFSHVWNVVVDIGEVELGCPYSPSPSPSQSILYSPHLERLLCVWGALAGYAGPALLLFGSGRNLQDALHTTVAAGSCDKVEEATSSVRQIQFEISKCFWKLHFLWRVPSWLLPLGWRVWQVTSPLPCQVDCALNDVSLSLFLG